MPISRSVRGISLPVWASPPEALSARQRKVLWLLTLASMSYAFVNTLFTQTVAFAADEFGISTSAQGFAAAVVRWGIIISFPFVVLADRHGRRRIVILMAWLAPSVSALGALSPSFPFLVATQTVGRPLGLTLEILIAVITIEEMPTQCRAYAMGVLAVASGIKAAIFFESKDRAISKIENDLFEYESKLTNGIMDLIKFGEIDWPKYSMAFDADKKHTGDEYSLLLPNHGGGVRIEKFKKSKELLTRVIEAQALSISGAKL